MTARDIAHLAAMIIREFPEYYKWYSQKEFTYNDITQYNRNKLLWRDDSVDGMKTGQIPYMCEHCTKVGMFTMMGVKFDEVPQDFGQIVLWQSADTSVVAQLQAFGQRNNEEYAKFAAKMKETPTKQ
jgi:hypothetical protein